MRILKAADYRRMPWRNGGGETAEVAIGPENATMEDFHWRVSMARMSVDGPFSIFPGIDRTVMVLRGDGVKLTVKDDTSVSLTTGSEPLAFSGDLEISASLLGRPITDLNVMTRRTRHRHTMGKLRVSGSDRVLIDAPLVLLVCAETDSEVGVQVGTNRSVAKLGPLDTLILESDPVELLIHSGDGAVAYLIQIYGRSTE